MRTDNILEDRLHHFFGYNTFRKGQKEAVEAAVAKKDSLVMLPTGTGKSICYQLSGYLMEGLVVVVSPLLSLMEDQVAQMRKRGEKRVAALNSFLKPAEKAQILRSLAHLKFLFLSPEMLYQMPVLQQLKKQKVTFLAVDEAHCISQWGFDFRPEYLNLGAARRELGFPVTMALTATATKEVQEEIKKILAFTQQGTVTVSASVDRPNIFLKVEHCAGDKQEKLMDTVKRLPKPGIIYFSSKKAADQCVESLQINGVPSAEAYHSDISSEDKIKIQAQFTNGNIPIICATSAFGMGIDKPDIRFVLHYHLPGSPEQYLQEFGRCGRDGKPAIAILFYETGDIRIQRHLIDANYPTEQMLKESYRSKGKAISLDGNDVQTALAKYYAESGISLEKALHLIQSRKVLKERQLSWMERYTRQNCCLREQIIGYFGEKPEETPPLCCSFCQPDGEQKYLETAKEFEKSQIESETFENWTKIIEKLFQISSF